MRENIHRPNHHLFLATTVGSGVLFASIITITSAYAQEDDNTDDGGGTNPAAPVLIMPSDMEFQATDLEEAVKVAFTVRAQDNVDGTATLDENNILTQDTVGGDLAISCDPPSGSMLRPADASYHVNCTATDADGNSGSGSFTITVIPPQPAEPTLTIISNDCSLYPEFLEVRYRASGFPPLIGAVVFLEIGDEDRIVGGGTPFTNRFGNGEGGFLTPATAPGPYTLTFYEDNNPHDLIPDPGGAQASTTFTCEQEDTTPPVITVPEDITDEATSPDGAEVSFEVSAEDDVDEAVDVSCDYSSGDTFPIGETLVTCSAEDGAGNRAEESFTITVQDTTPPDVEITGAIDRSGREITDGSGRTPIPYIEITFEATDAVGIDEIECSLDGQAFTSCTSPISYDRLSRTTHEVTVRATDEAGNIEEDEFRWTLGAPPSNRGGGGNG